MELIVTTPAMGAEELQQLLTDEIDDSADVAFETRETDVVIRGIDPTVLVAVIGAAGVALGSLVTGALRVAEKRRAGKVILRARDGTTVEFPVETPMETVDEYISRAKTLDLDRIEIC